MVSAIAREQIRSARDAVLALWLLGWALFIAPACAPPSGISYVYDENGRLVAVEDPNQGTSVYTYDLAGNVTAITPYSVSKIKVLSFSPPCAPIGSSLTINGTGFDGTDTITFTKTDGTMATASVNSATYSQLVTTVPSGAGPPPGAATASVTVSSGSDSDSKSFTVGCGAPVITSFNPRTGSPGTSVTITGQNFSGTLGDNRVDLNIRLASIQPPVSTTSLTVTTPAAAGSGPFYVSTPLGRARSSQDFFVPPPADVATDPLDLNASGRFPPLPPPGPNPSTKSVTFASANTIGIVVFDGQVGQRIGGTATLNDGSGINAFFGVTFMSPANQAIAQGGGRTPFIDAQVLPLTGTYSFVLDASAAGTATVQLYNVPPDLTAPTLVIGNPSVTVTLAPFQNAALPFNNPVQKTVTVHVGASSLGTQGGCGTVQVSTVPSPTYVPSGGCGNQYVTITNLPAGPYTLTIDPHEDSSGSITVWLTAP